MSIAPIQVRKRGAAVPGVLGLLSLASGVLALLMMPGPTSVWALVLGGAAVGLALRSRRALKELSRGRGWALAVPGFICGGIALMVTGLAYIASLAVAIA